MLSRRFYLPKNGTEPKPGCQGIALRLCEWATLKESIVQLHDTMPALTDALPCSFSVDHSNLIGFLKCRKCSPFDVMDHYTPLQQDVDTCDYESMTKHAFGGQTDEDECDFRDMSHHKLILGPVDLRITRRTFN